ncbi:hypothetical protein DUNSADRAFT_13988 [Dunaliella salina]|uniref:Uncharacterized protein n=1 Tax=Dunaliella salina TaxID=3046 RepID=A0ABQ7G888_DUNSA|nr:hypothetical protein DUNSADRAFT_13988 [Dunaliella salina]|eukprot:KAF5830818.1 hypothetical protein DUNSADRAFT_13988 [Dunaliella salina]
MKCIQQHGSSSKCKQIASQGASRGKIAPVVSRSLPQRAIQAPLRQSPCSPRPSLVTRGLLDKLKQTIGAGEGSGGSNTYERPSIENMGLDYYDADEVEHYFNYMGLLATEGTYDRMNLLKSMHHPAHVILLLASQENDDPKIAELLAAGADLNVKDNNGKTPLELATKPEALNIMKEHLAKKGQAS